AQRHRHHRHRIARDDFLDTVAELVNLAIGGQLAFREDAHHFTGIQLCSDALERLVVDLRVARLRIDRDRLAGAENIVEHRHVIDRLEHDEAHRAANGTGHDQRIDIADMVAHQYARAFLGNIVEAVVLHAIDGVRQHPDQQADQELRHDGIDVRRHQHIGQRQHQEELRNGQLDEADQHDAGDCRAHHQQGIENVVGGNDARQVTRIRAMLDEGEQRHDIKTAEHTDAEQVDQDAQATRLRQELLYADIGGVTQSLVGKEQVDTEHTQANRAERHQAQLDATAGHLFTQEGTEADTDGEGGEQEGIQAFGAMQVVVDVHLQLGGISRAQEPEPGNAEHADPHRMHLARVAKDTAGFAQQVPVHFQ